MGIQKAFGEFRQQLHGSSGVRFEVLEKRELRFLQETESLGFEGMRAVYVMRELRSCDFVWFCEGIEGSWTVTSEELSFECCTSAQIS